MKTCECGCGQTPKINPDSNARRGYVRGQPRRFVAGHQGRGRRASTAAFDALCVVNPETGCIEWTGSRSRGYGSYWDYDSHKTVHAYRYAYEKAKGPIPDGLTLDHLCRNQLCVNPDHLEAVTLRENILRGNGPYAINKRKTHCIHGHEFTAENTYVHRGYRNCRRCASEANAAAYARKTGKPPIRS